MFELLSEVLSVPIRPDALTTIHRGMNKVRVSVAEHNSEPSEVYIITGQVNGNLETYIIFYMLQPRIHVVYGCEQNPYPDGQKEQILEEATNFVEQMGSILEEIPWESMTPDQRSAWIEKEILYSKPDIQELDEVEEIETLELEEVEESGAEEAGNEKVPDPPSADDVVEVSEEEMQQALDAGSSMDDLPEASEMDQGTGGVPPEEDEMDESDTGSVADAGKEDVVIAEGDFDELLKQAFLKPDIVEKTRRKAAAKTEEHEEEDPFVQELSDPERSGAVPEEEELLSGEGDEVGPGEEPEILPGPGVSPDEADDDGFVPSERKENAGTVETFSDHDARDPSEKDQQLKVIRFLSRF